MLLPRFHLITPVCDPAWLRPLVDAGVDAIQVRDKQVDDRSLLRFTSAVRELDVVVIVNDRVDIALASGAHGVHVGADDLPVSLVRRLAPALVVGATCRSRDEVLAAQAAGASYAGVGPVHASTTKPQLPAPLGFAGVAAIVGALPVIAVGGVGASSVPSLLDAGAHGVAVVAAVWDAPDPPRAAREIATALRVA